MGNPMISSGAHVAPPVPAVVEALPQAGGAPVARDAGWTALRRDAAYRRALIAADVLAAVAALLLAVHVPAGAGLEPSALLLLPVAVLASKVIGLYDRDELLLRKGTLDEAPALFQLATLYALGAAVLGGTLFDGRISGLQIVALWVLLFVLALFARAVARGVALRLVPPERCLLVGAGGDAPVSPSAFRRRA